MTLIFVDCEGHGPAPTLNNATLFEFGAVEYDSLETFHGKEAKLETFLAFEDWLKEFKPPYVFVSDNPAYDWQFINYYFHLFRGKNPFGHSARRIGDYYAGLCGEWRIKSWKWKKLRITKHDHHPVNDAMGNVEAFRRIQNGER